MSLQLQSSSVEYLIDLFSFQCRLELRSEIMSGRRGMGPRHLGPPGPRAGMPRMMGPGPVSYRFFFNNFKLYVCVFVFVRLYFVFIQPGQSLQAGKFDLICFVNLPNLISARTSSITTATSLPDRHDIYIFCGHSLPNRRSITCPTTSAATTVFNHHRKSTKVPWVLFMLWA